MKIRHVAFTTLFGASLFIGVLGLPQRTLSETGSSPNKPVQKVGKEDVDKFCAQSTNTPKPGIQFDGKDASSAVMQLQFGKYEYPNEGGMLLFPNKHFLLKLPTDRNGIYGTDGDDLLFTGGIVGGCSLEQLSEAISKNSLGIDAFNLVKIYQ